MPAILIPGRASKAARPRVPRLNRDSEQVKGLRAWVPFTGRYGVLFDQLVGMSFTAQSAYATTGISSAGLSQDLPGFSNSYILTAGGYHPAYAVTTFTIAMWVYPHSFQANSPFISGIVRISRSTGVNDLMIRLGDLGVAPNHAQALIDPSRVNGTIDLSAHALNLIVSTYDGTTLSLYINGVLDGSTGVSYSESATERIVRFGTDDSGGRAPDAAFVDFRLWDRALTANEVWGLYDPTTRWDFYWVPGRRIYVDVGSTPPTGRTSRLALLGVA